MTQKIQDKEAYPLDWPEGWKRTDGSRRRKSNFAVSFATARDDVFRQLEMLGAKRAILSTNIPIRLDGLPYANYVEPGDPGVALYFDYKGSDRCFACDKFRKVWENIRAIGLTISSIRAIERYGASDMMERAFKGFMALPEKAGEYWREVLEIPLEAKPNREHIEKAFRSLAHVYHPDKGGKQEEWLQLCLARQNALRDIGAQ